MNDSNCLVSVSVSVGNGGATATVTALTPTPCDNIDNTASVGSYDTVDLVAVSAASDDSDNTASVSSEVAPSADATAAETLIVSDDSDNTVSFGGDDASTAGSRRFSDPAASITADAPNLSIDSDNTPVRRNSATVSITTDTPLVADAANTSVNGVSAAAVALYPILLTILRMSSVRTHSSAHCVVPESGCSSTSLRWNSRTA